MRNRFILSTRGRCSMRWETFHPIHSSRSSRYESGAAEADSPKPSVVGSHQIAQRPADQPTPVGASSRWFRRVGFHCRGDAGTLAAKQLNDELGLIWLGEDRLDPQCALHPRCNSRTRIICSVLSSGASAGLGLTRIFHSRERTGGFCGGARFGFPNGVVHRLWFAGHKARQVRGRVISAICQEMWRQCSPGWNFWKGPGLPMVVSRRPDTTRPALGHSARSSTAPATPDSSAPALGAHSP